MSSFVSGSLSLQLPLLPTHFKDPWASSSHNSTASSAQFNKNSSFHLIWVVLFKAFYASSHWVLSTTLWDRDYHVPLLEMRSHDLSKLGYVPLLSAPRAPCVYHKTYNYLFSQSSAPQTAGPEGKTCLIFGGLLDEARWMTAELISDDRAWWYGIGLEAHASSNLHSDLSSSND